MSVTPSFEAFQARAHRAFADGATSTVIPVLREILADALTPVQAFAVVGDGPGSYLLESVVGGEARARYSFVGFSPELRVSGGAGYYEVATADAAPVRRASDDPFQDLRETLASYRPAPSLDGPERAILPPFWGGAVGYVAYDAVRRFEPTVEKGQTPPDALGHEFSFAVGGVLLAFDNVRHVVQIVVPVRVRSDDDLRARYDRAATTIDACQARLADAELLGSLSPPDRNLEVTVPESSFDRGTFCAAVERCKEYIRLGDIFQVVLSQRFRVPAGRDLFRVYRNMRCLNPSPYMYFLRCDGTNIAGASPETLVRLRDGEAQVRPIAGTRRRGQTAEEDRHIEADLFADPKEIAEHVMLVDLGRNDIGRISEPGTVEVSERMVAEYYSHVMHITSNVRGKLAPGRDAIDVLQATFPAGTLSGAPKVRAMQIIEELEPEPRGIYGGAVGYLGFDGNMDMAIAIRTVVEHDGEYWVQAGAGIVEASRPDAEYEETLSKARAALLSIEADGER